MESAFWESVGTTCRTAPEEGKKTRKQIPKGPSVISLLENWKTWRWIYPRTSRSQALVKIGQTHREIRTELYREKNEKKKKKEEASRAQLSPCIGPEAVA